MYTIIAALNTERQGWTIKIVHSEITTYKDVANILRPLMDFPSGSIENLGDILEIVANILEKVASIAPNGVVAKEDKEICRFWWARLNMQYPLPQVLIDEDAEPFELIMPCDDK